MEFFKDLKISKISAGGYHSLCLTTNNQLYIWGAEVFGDMNNTPLPKLLTIPKIEESEMENFKGKEGN